MKKIRGQASFFDGLMFLFIVIFSVSLVFITLNSYASAQDKVLRTAYLANYLESSAKMVYYLDVSTLQNVKSYCKDKEVSTDSPTSVYCKTDYDLDCSILNKYKGRISVADLVKKDLDSSDGSGIFDDKYGTSEQFGRTSARCAMKEVMKPFTLSGYRYITEFGEASTASDKIIYPPDKKYVSDYIFTQAYAEKALVDSSLDCAKISSDQLLVIRTPFKLLEVDQSAQTINSQNYIMRTCLWPTNDLTVKN
ncbi:hypothetical protein HY989_01250 [Candidatus Micrarchaeota archaeon]|nr:hypothetical protein [Candidatus Micrarchaeota archaeon]